MSTPRIVLKTETRMLGAAQVMIGLIHCALGYIWMQLYVRQIELLSLTYMPIALLSGYPFLGTLSYVISGIFAIEAEKKCSPKLLACTIKVNIHSLAVAMIGLVITLTEITLFLLNQVELQWAHKSGIILSVYLCIFAILEFYIANTVARWGIQASQHGSYSI
ncbi:membrane-spanning 4-domains subfamily A member 12-like isoform X1 [Eptesicus fuscus]|uniref:membrane-spanning 4-domains subfamily A member 12-like isoform X1 n=1 Tax=Eptesicus fuscus TaxID=29078 RepID=UPI00240411DF|nr:membrane-spanning 4-domains subfamily A member 12-like isoform X1 [Eptesicus fuscus]